MTNFMDHGGIGHGYPQIDKCKSYCSLKDLKIDEQIIENCSGTLTLSKRPQGFKLLQKLKKGDAIVCLDISRFSRNSLDLLQMVEQFKKKKITLHAGDHITYNNTLTDIAGSKQAVRRAIILQINAKEKSIKL